MKSIIFIILHEFMYAINVMYKIIIKWPIGEEMQMVKEEF